MGEAEYIAAGSSCTQLLWMRQMLQDYGISQGTMTVFCDNTSAINISNNPVQHSKTKHIDIRHHFIRDLVEDGAVMEVAVRVRRPVMQHELRPPATRSANPFVKLRFLPLLEQQRLALGKVAAHRKRCIGKIKGLFIVGHQLPATQAPRC